MNTNFSIALCLCATGAIASAASRSSANYQITAEINDSGGQRATSASYTHDSSTGLIAGISVATAPTALAKHGYIGQLFEVAGFVLNATPLTIDEAGARQLSAWHLLDDATLLFVDPARVSWSALSGPIASISASGLATAGIVYQNAPASVQGSLGALTASLNLTLLDVIPDNFGSYAGDGVGDDWQVQYFGLPPNPAAGPLLDPDGDRQNNRFEWIAGSNPTDPASVFKLRIERSFQGAHIVFSPVVSGRTYTVTYRHDLLALPPWPALSPGLPIFDNGSERTVIDTDAHTVPSRFYRVEITK